MENIVGKGKHGNCKGRVNGNGKDGKGKAWKSVNHKKIILDEDNVENLEVLLRE